MSHEYHHNCGCDTCCRDELYHQAIDEVINDTANAWMRDPVKLRDAEQWVAGTHSGEHYTEVTLALAELHCTHPENLAGSDLLARLYRLARVEYDALYAQVREMARAEIERGRAA